MVRGQPNFAGSAILMYNSSVSQSSSLTKHLGSSDQGRETRLNLPTSQHGDVVGSVNDMQRRKFILANPSIVRQIFH